MIKITLKDGSVKEIEKEYNGSGVSEKNQQQSGKKGIVRKDRRQ